ncbi:hypothetical protein AVEN_142910-1 [Araneus ventricosus]|uniref:Uncharacterized protein n=1 Tax=Araneus ventricosus TaxID=182803 RepID=A0A4Y2FMY0_ARAVE|nr:hypothetical protein AVEN_142910-1 [Araneus ventricosus]
MKKRVGIFRRRAQRAPTELRQAACIIYSRERAQYRRHLVKMRRSAWRKFCMEASIPFRKQYNAIFRAGRPPSDLFQQSTPAGTELSFSQNILETLYPHTLQAPFIGSTAASQPNDSPFSSRELWKVKSSARLRHQAMTDWTTSYSRKSIKPALSYFWNCLISA